MLPYSRDKYLILPDGLDKLEQKIYDELAAYNTVEVHEIVSHVFARFKKELK